MLTFKGRPAPLWCWLLLGWLLAFTASRLTALPNSVGPESAPDFPPLAPLAKSSRLQTNGLSHVPWPAFDPDWSFEAMSPRQLRALPEIGPKRAVQIAETRWEQGLTAAPRALDAPERPKLDLESVPGIGPQTERLARKAALSKRRRAPRNPIPSRSRFP